MVIENVDFEKNQSLNQVIENRTDFPAEPVEGQLIWRSDLNHFYIYDGADWGSPQMGTLYLSIPACDFTSWTPATDIMSQELGYLYSGQNGLFIYAPIFLPHGAVVKAVVVYGNAGTNNATWYLMRSPNNAGSWTDMASAFCNTEDNTINFATIDNQNYGYFIYVTDVDFGDRIYGARITYTL